jgi:plasmid stability protein
MKQMKVALPDDLRQALDVASQKSGRSVAEEIRARVAASLEQETQKLAVDNPTHELAEDIVALANAVRAHKGISWHEDLRAREALIEAIKGWITEFPLALRSRLSAPGHRPVGASSDAAPDLWGKDDAATLGRAIARHHQLAKSKKSQSAT